MKQSMSLITLIFFAVNIYSQTINFNNQTGIIENSKAKEQVANFKPLGSFDNTFTYLLLPYSKDVVLGRYYGIEKYDSDLNLILRKQIDLKEGKNTKDFVELINFQDKLYLFTSFTNKDKKKVYLFVQTMDKDNFTPNKDIRKIAEFEYKKKNHELKAGYSISEDSTKLLLYASLNILKLAYVTGGNLGEEIKEVKQHLLVFDKSVNLIWKNEISPALKYPIFVFDKYYIDNFANVYITGKNFNTEEDMFRHLYRTKNTSTEKRYVYVQPSNYKTSIMYFSSNGSEIKQINLSLDNTFVKSILIKPERNHVFCAGIYSLPNKISAQGVFSCSINTKTGKIQNQKTKVFDKKYLETRLDEKELDKFQKVVESDELDPFNYSLSEMKIRNNGDYVFVAEQQSMGKMITSTPQMTLQYNTYNFRDLFVTTMSTNGDIKSINMIEKNQFVRHDFAHSYSFSETNNNLCFIFNEIPPLKDSYSKFSKLEYTYLVSIDNNNNQKRDIVKEYAKTNKKTLIANMQKAMYDTSQKTLIYPMQTYNYKSRSYGKISID